MSAGCLGEYHATLRGRLRWRCRMKCPECGLISPDEAMRCDCGFAFKAGAPPLKGVRAAAGRGDDNAGGLLRLQRFLPL